MGAGFSFYICMYALWRRETDEWIVHTLAYRPIRRGRIDMPDVRRALELHCDLEKFPHRMRTLNPRHTRAHTMALGSLGQFECHPGVFRQVVIRRSEENKSEIQSLRH